MTGIEFKRMVKQGVVNFWRNGWVSLATVLIMVITLFVVGTLFFSNLLLTSALQSLEKKVDISVYFTNEAQEEEIASLQIALKRLAEVDSIAYISRFLESGSFGSIIDKINYRQNQVVIDRLTSLIAASRALGLGITVVLAFIAILVTFNTIRLAIYTSKDEISIMRLVGASNSYIRGPFLVEGMIHGLFATIVTMVIFWPLAVWLGPKASRFFGGPNLFNYYLSNFVAIFLML